MKATLPSLVAASLLSVALTGCGEGKVDEGGRDDRAELEALAQRPAPCSTAADCCVVTDECTGRAFVVGQHDYAHAEECVAGLDQHSGCVGCSAPVVELQCVDGACVGVILDASEASAGHHDAHCGGPDAGDEHDHSHSSDSDHGRVLHCG